MNITKSNNFPTFNSQNRNNNQSTNDTPLPKSLKIALATICGAIAVEGYVTGEYNSLHTKLTTLQSFKKAGKWGALVGGIAGFVLSTLALRDTTPKISNKLNKLA